MDNKFKGFVIVAIIVLFIGMAAGGFYLVPKILGGIDLTKEEQPVYNPKDIQIFQLTESITTNLTSEEDSNKNHIIKVTVGFGINKKSKDFKNISKQFQEKEMLVRDEIIQSLRDQSYENMTRSDAQSKLSETIQSRISTLLLTQAIEEIYFGEFFVQ